jgi:hypothetical protein
MTMVLVCYFEGERGDERGRRRRHVGGAGPPPDEGDYDSVCVMPSALVRGRIFQLISISLSYSGAIVEGIHYRDYHTIFLASSRRDVFAA